MNSKNMVSHPKIKVLFQFWQFMKENKKFWLLPMFVILLSFGLLLIFAQGSAFAPFIYTIF